MVWSRRKNGRTARVETLLGRQVELHGDLLFSGGVHVDGKVCGNVHAVGEDPASMLVLSRHGTVEGEIRVPHIVVNGLVVGDIYATDSVELAASARISGNVYYRRIEIAMGAEINGNLVHLDDSEGGAATGAEAGIEPGLAGQGGDL